MIKIFADTGKLDEIELLDSDPMVQGFTTNPTIMRKAGVEDYWKWANYATQVTDKPISFEVFSDDADEMVRQANTLSELGPNVYIKVPITAPSSVIRRLQDDVALLNITAVLAREQVSGLVGVLSKDVPTIVSIFAGRIADTGVDPMKEIQWAKATLSMYPNVKILWASPREVYNIYQADEAGADIITITPELLVKYRRMMGKDLLQLSKETVEMFNNDAKGYTL